MPKKTTTKKTKPIAKVKKVEKTKKGLKVTAKKTELFICGKSEEKIRKAYFENTLSDLLNEIQAEKKWLKEDIEELGAYLGALKGESKDFVNQVEDVFGGKIIEHNKPPSVEELREGLTDEAWREKAEKYTLYVERVLLNIRESIDKKLTFPVNYWGNMAMNFLEVQGVLEKDLIYKKQLYKAKLTQIIDDFGVSRKEAEERSQLGKEYFDYCHLSKLVKRMEEFYTFARRRDDGHNHR